MALLDAGTDLLERRHNRRHSAVGAIAATVVGPLIQNE